MELLYIVMGIIAAILVCCLICLVHRKTDLDRKTDDEQQMKYIEQYNQSRKKDRH